MSPFVIHIGYIITQYTTHTHTHTHTYTHISYFPLWFPIYSDGKF